MLTGRLVGVCGDKFSGVYRQDRHFRQYRCRNSLFTAEHRCDDRRLRADDVEFVVCEAVRELLAEPERLLALAEDYLSLRGSTCRWSAARSPPSDAKIATADSARPRLRSRPPGRSRRQRTSSRHHAHRAERDDLVRYRAQLEAWTSAGAVQSDRMRRLWELAEVAHTRLRT
jgi:hypothetical protein